VVVVGGTVTGGSVVVVGGRVTGGSVVVDVLVVVVAAGSVVDVVGKVGTVVEVVDAAVDVVRETPTSATSSVPPEQDAANKIAGSTSRRPVARTPITRRIIDASPFAMRGH